MLVSVLFILQSAGAAGAPCARYAGVWTAPPVHTPTQTQVSFQASRRLVTLTALTFHVLIVINCTGTFVLIRNPLSVGCLSVCRCCLSVCLSVCLCVWCVLCGLQVSMVDGPIAGNGLIGVSTAPHRESWPASPSNATHRGQCLITVFRWVRYSRDRSACKMARVCVWCVCGVCGVCVCLCVCASPPNATHRGQYPSADV